MHKKTLVPSKNQTPAVHPTAHHYTDLAQVTGYYMHRKQRFRLDITNKTVSFSILNVSKPTFNILISFPNKFCDLAKFFFVMLLMATTKFGF